MAISANDRLYSNIMLLMQSCINTHEPSDGFEERLKNLSSRIPEREFEVIAGMYQLLQARDQTVLQLRWYVERHLQEDDLYENYNLIRLLNAYYVSSFRRMPS